MADYTTPSFTITSTSGRYSGSGVNYTVTGTANYYLYVQDPTTYTWYRKGQLSSSGRLTGVNVGQGKTEDTFYTYFVLSSTDQGLSLTFGNYILDYACSVSVPLYICQIYKGSSTKETYNNVTNPSLLSNLFRIDCEEVYGLTTGANTSIVTVKFSSLNNGWSSFGSKVDGKTLYTVYKNYTITSTATKYYYRGSASRKSVKATITTIYEYLYGTGYASGASTSMTLGSMTTTCLSDTSYKLSGWTTTPTSTLSGAYTIYAPQNPELAFNDGYNTIYGVYTKENIVVDTKQLTYYRGTKDPQSCTQTKTASLGVYYGDQGDHATSDDITTTYANFNSSCLVANWELIGWAYDATTQYATLKAENLFNSGYTTIYGTYKQKNVVTFYPQNGNEAGTRESTSYRYGNGLVANNIPSEPVLKYDGYTFLGWATDDDGEADTWSNQYNNGAREVYAIWEKDGNVYLGVNGEWILLETYYGVNGKWVPMQIKVGAKNAWN